MSDGARLAATLAAFATAAALSVYCLSELRLMLRDMWGRGEGAGAGAGRGPGIDRRDAGGREAPLAHPCGPGAGDPAGRPGSIAGGRRAGPAAGASTPPPATNQRIVTS